MRRLLLALLAAAVALVIYRRRRIADSERELGIARDDRPMPAPAASGSRDGSGA